MRKVVLCGTYDSEWRKELTDILSIDVYNSIMDDSTTKMVNPKLIDTELRERKSADFFLSAITPKMEDYYTIVKIVEDSKKKAS